MKYEYTHGRFLGLPQSVKKIARKRGYFYNRTKNKACRTTYSLMVSYDQDQFMKEQTPKLRTGPFQFRLFFNFHDFLNLLPLLRRSYLISKSSN